MKTRVNVGHLTQLLQQKSYLPWLAYGLSTLLVVLLQTAPNAFPTIFFARPTPLTTFVICIAILGGARTGTTVGVIAGLFWGVFSSRIFGFDAVVLLLLGLAAGLLVEWYLRANFYTALLLCTCGVVVHMLLEWFFCYVILQKPNVVEILFRVLLPNGLYTIILTPIVYWFVYMIARFARQKETM